MLSQGEQVILGHDYIYTRRELHEINETLNEKRYLATTLDDYINDEVYEMIKSQVTDILLTFEEYKRIGINNYIYYIAPIML